MVQPAAAQQAELNAALARAFAALADPTRCAVVELLRERPLRASDLAAALDIAPAGLSRHLRQLERSGLVAADAVAHDARVRLYRLEPHVFDTLSDWAAAMRDEWSQQLQAFKAHAERAVAGQDAKTGTPAPPRARSNPVRRGARRAVR